MKHVTKQHPLKPISLSFQEGKQPPAFEVEALKRYKKAHDETWKRRLEYVTQKGQLMLINSEIGELSYEIFALEDELGVYEEALGISEPPEPSTLGPTYDFDLNALFDRTREHNLAVQRIHQQVVDASVCYNDAVTSLYEDDFLIDPMYFDILHEVYRRYDEVEVDIVSLDTDHQAFLEAYGEVNKLREEYMQLGQHVFDAYTQLLDDANDFYRRTERVGDRLDEEMDGK